jgi:phosphotransferase system enzyme I (PtsI)
VIPDLGAVAEANHELGWRSFRICLSDEEGFRAQLRAILRASSRRNVRLLIPMVSAVEEIRRVRALVDETKEELTRRGACFDPDLPIGVMIEIPSAALISAGRSILGSVGSVPLPPLNGVRCVRMSSPLR